MIDLYLDGDLGLWVLERVSIGSVGTVITTDSEIIDQAAKLGLKVIEDNPNLIEFISSKFAISVHYHKILKPKLIYKYLKIYNLHPSFLPFGRGYYPIFWALWENTPAGATLHEINEGIDEGNIIAQIKVDYDETDTGESLFNRVRDAEKKIFLDYWEKISKGEEIDSFPQPKIGSYHSKKDFLELKQNFDWSSVSSAKLIQLARCLSFSKYSGLEISLGKKKYELRLNSLE